MESSTYKLFSSLRDFEIFDSRQTEEILAAFPSYYRAEVRPFSLEGGTHPAVYTNHSGRVWRRQDKEALLHALTSRLSPLYSRAIRCETVHRVISAQRASR